MLTPMAGSPTQNANHDLFTHFEAEVYRVRFCTGGRYPFDASSTINTQSLPNPSAGATKGCDPEFSNSPASVESPLRGLYHQHFTRVPEIFPRTSVNGRPCAS